MALSLSLSPIFSLLLLLLLPCIATSHNPHGSTDLVRASCRRASYPSLCLRTLSNYPTPPARTLPDLAQAAVKVSLYRALKASNYLARLARSNGPKRGRRERGAIKDCAEQVSEAVSQLKDTSRELKKLKTGSFGWRMSNAKTWVSAAITCQSTCLDGISEVDGVGVNGGEGKKVVVMGDDVRRKIGSLTKVTSNALYLINLLDAKGKP